MGADQNVAGVAGATSSTIAQTTALPAGPTAQNGPPSRRLKRAQTPQISGMVGDDSGPAVPLLPLRAQSGTYGVGVAGAGLVLAPIASPQPLSPLTPPTPALFTFGSPSHLPQLLRQPSRNDYYNVIKPPAEQQPTDSPATPSTPQPQTLTSFIAAPSNR